MNDNLVGVEDLADALGVPVSWVYKHVDQIPTVRVGRYVRFEKQAVLEYLKGQSIKSVHIPRCI